MDLEQQETDEQRLKRILGTTIPPSDNPIDDFVSAGMEAADLARELKKGPSPERKAEIHARAKELGPTLEGDPDADRLARILGTKIKVPPASNVPDASTMLGLGMNAVYDALQRKAPDVQAPAAAPAPQPLVAGNIDLAKRPRVQNEDGSFSTVKSMSIDVDGKEVLIPMVSDDGRVLSSDQAIALYRKTGKHLGIFDSPESATAYAKDLHARQEAMGSITAPSVQGPRTGRASGAGPLGSAVKSPLPSPSAAISKRWDTDGFTYYDKDGRVVDAPIEGSRKLGIPAMQEPKKGDGPSRGSGPVASGETVAQVPEDAATPPVHPIKWLAKGLVEEFGLDKLWRGLSNFANPDPRAHSLSDLSDIIEGAFNLGTPAMAIGAVAKPVITAAMLAAGIVGQTAGENVADALGASPETARFFGNMGALLGGFAGERVNARFGPTGVPSAREIYADALDKALETLGVERNASADEIKAAYRKASYEAHPDRGGSDAAQADLNLAYQWLKANHTAPAKSMTADAWAKDQVEWFAKQAKDAVPESEASPSTPRQIEAPKTVLQAALERVAPDAPKPETGITDASPTLSKAPSQADIAPTTPTNLPTKTGTEVAQTPELLPMRTVDEQTFADSGQNIKDHPLAARIESKVPLAHELEPIVARELRKIREEMRTFRFENADVLSGDELDANSSKDGFNDSSNERMSYRSQPGNDNLKKNEAGAPVYHDILAHGGYGTRGKVIDAIEKYLDGGPATRSAVAAVKVARRMAWGTPEGMAVQPLGKAVKALSLPESGWDQPGEVYIDRPRLRAGKPDHPIEERTARAVEKNPKKFINLYEKANGNVINADDAAELFPSYAGSNDLRRTNVYAVRPAAHAIVNAVWDKALEAAHARSEQGLEPVPEGKLPMVTFLGGGTGSGKSTLLRRDPDIKNDSYVVFDSTFANRDYDDRKIEEAKRAGLSPVVRFVYRDPIEAWTDGVLPRAMATGRPVSIQTHARTHMEAVRNALDLEARQDPEVYVRAYRNFGGSVTEVPTDWLREQAARYNDRHGLESQLQDATVRAYKTGQIDAPTFRSVTGENPPVDRRDDTAVGQASPRDRLEEVLDHSKVVDALRARVTPSTRIDTVPAKSFSTFLAEKGIPDPGIEHGFLRATAQMSKGALKRAMANNAAMYPAVAKALDEYHALRESGAIPDVQHERDIRDDSDADQAYLRVQEKRAARLASKKSEPLTQKNPKGWESADTMPIESADEKKARLFEGVKNMEPREPQQWSREALQESFGLTPEQAEATDILAREMFTQAELDQRIKVGTLRKGQGDLLFQPAWHGSPHIFDEFSLHKIGTGEGAQAYGWGLYFAGDKSVADYYRKALSGPRGSKNSTPILRFDGVAVDTDLPKEIRTSGGIAGMRELQSYARLGSISEVRKGIQEQIDGIEEAHSRGEAYHAIDDDKLILRSHREALELLDKYGDRISVSKPPANPGRTYKVDIPEDHEFLDWDKPISQQSEAVQKSLATVSDMADPKSDGYMPEATGAELYQNQTEMLGDPESASRSLSDAGVPGLRYLDGNSRNKSAGHHNYVVFDDKLVKIMEFEQRGNDPTGIQGVVEFTQDGKAIISGVSDPNASTGVHELAHVARRFLLKEAWVTGEDGEWSGHAAGITAEDVAAAQEWAGAKNGYWDTKAEEKFARGFEAYLGSGEAPSPKLKSIFERFSQWLKDIYGKLFNSPIKIDISPEMMKVYDRLVTRVDRIRAEKAEASTVEDTLSTGEHQPRLPGDVGKVRDAEVAQPKLTDVAPTGQMWLRAGKTMIPVSSFEDAGHKFDTVARSASDDGPGSSQSSKVEVVNAAGDVLAHISPNGRIWQGKEPASIAEWTKNRPQEIERNDGRGYGKTSAIDVVPKDKDPLPPRFSASDIASYPDDYLRAMVADVKGASDRAARDTDYAGSDSHMNSIANAKDAKAELARRAESGETIPMDSYDEPMRSSDVAKETLKALGPKTSLPEPQKWWDKPLRDVDMFDEHEKGDRLFQEKPTKVAERQGLLDDTFEEEPNEKAPSGNINLDKFPLPEPLKAELARVIEGNNGYIQQRRGVRSWAETRAVAEAIPPYKSVAKAGTAFNAEQLEAIAGQIVATREQLGDLSKKVEDGTADIKDRAQYAAMLTQEQVLLETYAGGVAEAGRALNILRKMRAAIQTNDMKLMEEGIKHAGGKEHIERVAKILNSFDKDDAIGKYRFIRSLQKPGVADWLTWYWYTNILSGPLTFMRNLLGNTAMGAFGLASQPFAGAVDLVRSKVTGTERSTYAGEMPMQIAGIARGAQDGWQKGLFLLKHGFTMDDVANTEFRPPEVAGGLATNFVGRALESADTLYRSMGYMQELYGQAYTAAKNAGLKLGSDEGHAFVTDFIANPPVRAVKEAARESARMIFRQKPGPLVNAIVATRKDIPVTLPSGRTLKLWNPLRLFIPFVQTPANIMKMSLESTPLGAFTAPLKDSARERSKAAGRAALGTMLLAPLVWLAVNGQVSGSGPDDKELKDALYRTGWQPNSIKIGSKWYSYSNFQPLALPLSIVANMVEAYQMTGKAPTLGTVIGKTANSVLQQSYLSGLSALQDMLQSPERRGQAFIEKLAASAMPLSSLQGQVARSLDPVIRQPDSIGESIQANTPGFSEGVRGRMDAFGHPATRDTGLSPGAEILAKLFSPVTISQVKDSPLEDELFRLRGELQIGFPSKSITIDKQTIPLSPAEYDRLQQITGPAIERQLTRRVNSAEWMGQTDAEKVDDLHKVINEVRKLGRERILMDVVDRVKAERRAKREGGQ